MFDAAGIVTGMEIAADQIAQAQADAALEPHQQSRFDDTAHFEEGERLLAALADIQTNADKTEIVFIDTSVNNYETLLQGIDPSAEVVLVDASQNGIELIADVLQGRQDVSAVHIISHGEAGELHLGSSTLTQESMGSEYSGELAIINQSLSANADILIYGCNFADGENGKLAADTLAELTGADVAASTDLSGHGDFDGDWNLEHQTGDIEAAGIVSEIAQTEWRGLLMDTDGDGVDDSLDVDDDNDGILDINEGGFTLVTQTFADLGLPDTTIELDPALPNPPGGASDTGAIFIDLSSLGVTAGETIVISGIEARGDLNGATETFDLDFGSGVTATGLQTGDQQFTTFVPISTADLSVTVVDNAGTPGIFVTATANDTVDDFAGAGFAVQVRFTIGYFVAASTDTDLDGIDDRLDLDSDNDGITDNVEAQATESYIAPNGIVDATGLDTAYAGGLTPVDSDGDGTADVLDTDSDRDGTDDIAERADGQPTSIISNTDTDGDGLLDIFENGTLNDGYDVNDDNLTGTTFNLGDSDDDLNPDGSNASGLITNLDFRENSGTDVDGDGVDNTNDVDADNDGILDSVEGASITVTNSTSAIITLVPVGGGASSDTTDIVLTGSGLSIGETVTISNILADGDLNGAGETFSLDFNSGEATTGAVATGVQHGGTLVALNPALAAFDVTVIDLGGGDIGFRVNSSATAAVDDLGQGYAVRFTFDYSYGIESGPDSDGDGIQDHLDIDSDNDGITDTVEAQTTAGYVFAAGADSDGDGLDDNFETGGLTPINTDGDATPDYLDTDSDGDGIDDIVERGDGAPTSLTSTTDTDSDGLLDIFEGSDLIDVDINDENLTGTTFNLADTDNDASADGSTASPPLADFDYREDQSADVDGDGISNAADIDADNDGILNTDEAVTTTFTSQNIDLAGDGDTTTVFIDLTGTGVVAGDTVTVDNVQADGDLDGGSETFDLDFVSASANNLQTGEQFNGVTAISTPISLTVTVVNNGSQVGFFATVTTDASVGQFGGNPYGARVLFDVTYADLDADDDGIINELDIDSDNDGITDNIEAQTTAGYVEPTGLDSDGDGLDDAYETGGLTPVDTDSDGVADFIDTDSDNDGRGDITERGDGQAQIETSSTDTDGDGLLDIFEAPTVSDIDPNDNNFSSPNFNLGDSDGDTAADGSGAIPLTADFDYRDGLTDADGDGINNGPDLDSDNDGILDSVEGEDQSGTVTTGIFELGEGPNSLTNQTVSLAGQGLAIGDKVTVTNFVASGDLDADVSVEFFRLNFNNGEALTDNLSTGVEHNDIYAAGSDPSTHILIPLADPVNIELTIVDIGGGVPGIVFDVNTPEGVNLLDQLYAARFQFDIVWSAPDFDNDGLPDYLDIDSDNDGITDNVEAQTTQGYIAPSGIGTGITDDNNDGLDDNYDPGALGTADGIGLTPVDTDGDGITDQYDSDSDGDLSTDIAERGDGQPRTIFSTTDTDADGLLDIFEGSTLFDIDANDENLIGTDFNLADTDNDTNTDGSNASPTTTDFDYRDEADTDQDGVPDANDIDADNDGILNINEGLSAFPGSISSGVIDIQAGSTTVTVIDLSAEGLQVGDIVNVSNLLADGDLDAAGETFTLDFNNGAVVVSSLSTDVFFEGPDPVTAPLDLELTVIDTDLITPGDQPGIIVTSSEQGPVGDDIQLGYAVRFTFDIDWTAPDTDGDGVFDYLDLDSDNDGISDLLESGSTNVSADTDFSGTLSLAEGSGDSDGDGLLNIFEPGGTTLVDSDSDGINDVLDLDSDNDGIADTIEFRPTSGYITNDGDVRDNDADGDGVIDIFDSNDSTTGDFGGSFSGIANDADGDTTPDYLDTDSENDGNTDIAETSAVLTLSGTDANQDGIDDDTSIGASYADPDGAINNPSSQLPNEIGDTSEIAFRETNIAAVNDSIAVGEVNETTGNTTLSINLLTNDTLGGATQPPGTFTVVSIDSSTATSTTVPSGSSATITTNLGALVTVHSDGTIEYDSNNQSIFTDLNFGDDPVDDSFTYTMTDGSSLQVSATVTITVGPNNEFVGASLGGSGTDGAVFNGGAASDQSGFQVASLGDVNGDGYDDFAISAVEASPNGIAEAGEVYVVFGKATPFNPTFELSTLATGGGADGFVIEGLVTKDKFGRSVDGGDINGDGYADIIIGAVLADPNGNGSGQVYVIFGGSSFGGVVDVSSLDGSNGLVLNGADPDDSAGRWVAYAGDVNGDGLGDILVGAPNADPNGIVQAGETYLIYGKTDFSPILTAGEYELADLSDAVENPGGVHGTVFEGASDFSGSGHYLAAGDFDGDGLNDIAIGAPFYYSGTYAEGATYLIYGQQGGFGSPTLTLSTLSGGDGFRLTGTAELDYAGKSVALAGDINGDGIDDLVVGAPYASPNATTYSGSTYVIYGDARVFSATQTIDSVADVTINGVQTIEAATGFSLAYAGDINGDGFDDLIIGRAPYAGVDAGSAYILFGSGTLPAAIELDGLTPSDSALSGGSATLTDLAGFVLSGIDLNDYAGQIVSSAGDVNGDGFADIIIGAYTAAPNGTYSGESYLLYGKDFRQESPIEGNAGTDSLTGTANDETLIGGDGNDTVDGAAGNDVLIGGNGDDTLIYDAADTTRVDGGGGNDTLSLATSGVSIDLTTISNTRYQGIEVIDLTGTLGGNAIKLSTLDLLALSGSSNVLTIDGDGDDFVEVSDGSWTLQSSSGGYDTYTNGAATLRVDSDIPILINLVDAAGEGSRPVEVMSEQTDQAETMIASYTPHAVSLFSEQLSTVSNEFDLAADNLMRALASV